ncbi:uncharacterized protein N7477_007501 [Penicillium maclennaniae]|uniref:uncharacterized protein n=1 Tax=Penicillium maclennaniae TaxID=1343394 RepID=UPI002541EC4E|nr:uncharacterized protein N7477_007501 [Penicillium maclennaniae]KAJ5665053.1 hypothetical protein N7477_007501 [Penicillium maclennaniae]
MKLNESANLNAKLTPQAAERSDPFSRRELPTIIAHGSFVAILSSQLPFSILTLMKRCRWYASPT